MIQQGRPKQLVDQLSPHRCREWHSDQTSDCLRLMPSLGGEHPSKKQKSEEVTSKPSDGPKLDSVRAPARGSKDGVLFAPLAFFLPETMPFLDTDLQTKSDEELASLKVALADLPVPLWGGSSSSSLFFHSFYAKGYSIYSIMQDVLGSHKIIYEKKALLVQFGRTRVSKTRCRRFKSYRA
ncbi:hypothetical protein LR48_Vigan10g198200 [Vigna angularis]|uniref:Uncharacterized protein n=1 Tax=Phaseolus angularis TaxID=3914 RepID=A0A0L9VM19_PHAAN|nr:hypothetical protein LR48_Vigan10g198200 [Vigna angularis]